MAPEDITGLVLAGGRGARMGGLDKGLQCLDGEPLALHAARRLAPQVGALAISANRNLPAYRAFAAPLGSAVWTDRCGDAPGPLAGVLSGLEHCTSAYLATVPCDAPRLPHDLVRRLGQALVQADADIAMAATREPSGVRAQPVCCVLRVRPRAGAPGSLRDRLAAFLAGGQRQVQRWVAQQHCVQVVFDDAAAFANANTAQELQALQRHG